MAALHPFRRAGIAAAALACAARLAASGVDAGARAEGSAFRDPFLDGSGRRGPEMVWIPAGSFLMGSLPAAPEHRLLEVPHRVWLAAFAVGRFEVTNEEYAHFLSETEEEDLGEVGPLQLGGEGAGIVVDGRGFRAAAGAARLPVTGVSWRGALAYGRWLSRRTGFLYTLPTEAQWERAARAESRSVWPWGDTFEPRRLNCRGGDGARPLPVGSHPANAFGAFDLLGNVWEWTLDCFAVDFYLYSPSRDPRLLDPGCLAPGIRGGSFRDPAGYCRPGYRANFWWRGNPESIGFRLVREADAHRGTTRE